MLNCPLHAMPPAMQCYRVVAGTRTHAAPNLQNWGRHMTRGFICVSSLLHAWRVPRPNDPRVGAIHVMRDEGGLACRLGFVVVVCSWRHLLGRGGHPHPPHPGGAELLKGAVLSLCHSVSLSACQWVALSMCRFVGRLLAPACLSPCQPVCAFVYLSIGPGMRHVDEARRGHNTRRPVRCFACLERVHGFHAGCRGVSAASNGLTARVPSSCPRRARGCGPLRTTRGDAQQLKAFRSWCW